MVSTQGARATVGDPQTNGAETVAHRNAALPCIELLGAFGLSIDGQPVALPISCQRLLVFLAFRRRATRLYVASMLFPDVSEVTALTRLRSVLARLNRSARGLVVSAGPTLSLHAEVGVDVDRLARTARRLCETDEPCRPVEPDDVEALIASSELLPGWYEDWVVLERERLDQLRVHALEQLSARALDAGQFVDALKAANAALHLDPFRESTHRSLIAVHLAENNPVAAVRQYRSYCRLLATEFGDARPTERMERLVAPFLGPAHDGQAG